MVTPHLGASTAEAQDKAGETIAEQVVLALRGDFVPFAVNVEASEASEVVRPYLPLAERIGRLFSGLAGGAPTTLEVFYEGEIADYDCRVLTLSILKGVLGPVVEEPVSFVNAPQLAEERGISVRETKSADAQNYVNLIEVRGAIGDHTAQAAGTLFGKDQEPRIVGIDEHTVDLPPARYMLVVHNSDDAGNDRPGHDRARRRQGQHLRHGRGPEPERRGRADGARHRLEGLAGDDRGDRRGARRAVGARHRPRLARAAG